MAQIHLFHQYVCFLGDPVDVVNTHLPQLIFLLLTPISLS